MFVARPSVPRDEELPVAGRRDPNAIAEVAAAAAPHPLDLRSRVQPPQLTPVRLARVRPMRAWPDVEPRADGRDLATVERHRRVRHGQELHERLHRPRLRTVPLE